MSHQRGGGAELSTSLSLSQATCGSSGKWCPPSLQDTPQGTGKEPGTCMGLACPGDKLWLAPSGDISQKHCLENM